MASAPSGLPTGTITVTGLGQGGVNLVKGPIALDDNELLLAQNAVPFNQDGIAGIRKRDGWQRVVPTGTVTPGSDAGGAILGGFTVDEPIGYASPDGADAFGNGYIFDSSTLTFTAFTPDQTSGPLPNVCMNYSSGYDVTKSTVYPPVASPATGSFIMGGHESGQIIEIGASRATRSTVVNQPAAREIARITGTGSVDDTFVLPCWAGRLSLQSLVVALSDGGVWLIEPVSCTTTKLPAVPNATRVTGAVWNTDRLWVCAGLKIYTLGLGDDGNWDTSWQDAATVSDSGIAQLVGMTNISAGTFMVGSYLSTGTLPNNVRLYVFSPTSTDGVTWTATQLAFPGGGGVQSNGTAMVQVSNSPALIIPFQTAVPNDSRIYALYVGTAGAFVTLWGSQSEDMQGTSVRLISYDPIIGWWHNGADTNTDDLVADYAGGAAISIAGLSTSLDGKILFAGNIVAGPKWAYITRKVYSSIVFNNGGPSNALTAGFFTYPVILL